MPVNSPLTMSAAGAGAGAIYYTINGTDPRLIGGGINPSAWPTTAPVSLANDATIKARFRTRPAGRGRARRGDVRRLSGRRLRRRWHRRRDGFSLLATGTWLASQPRGQGADGNRNGVVDGGDLAAWQYNFGGSGAAAVAASAVAAYRRFPCLASRSCRSRVDATREASRRDRPSARRCVRRYFTAGANSLETLRHNSAVRREDQAFVLIAARSPLGWDDEFAMHSTPP